MTNGDGILSGRMRVRMSAVTGQRKCLHSLPAADRMGPVVIRKFAILGQCFLH